MIFKGQLYKVIRGLTPPILLKAIKRNDGFRRIKRVADGVLLRNYVPKWHVISEGLLKGKNLFIAPNGVWQPMVDGDYDKFFLDYLGRLSLKGKVVYDVGAHFGFSSLCFAELVGPTGKVVAFEPNVFNQQRFELTMSHNQDLGRIIDLRKVALSDKCGEEDFIFSDNVDSGTSSGSFLGDADTFFEKNLYENTFGFKRVRVATVTLDELVAEKDMVPDLIKIDVEGAEHLVLSGGLKVLKERHPILLMEIHSILNMLKCGEILRDLGYEIELLKEEHDGRCFVAAS
jgi:FkbM family methyltransferase